MCSEILLIDGFDLFCITFRAVILDVFCLLRSSLCICVVCKCICVVSRVLVCCFFVRGHLVASFFFVGFAIGVLWSFPCFGSFLFILLLILSLSLVCTICFGCDVVSGCVLVWICDWFVKNLVDVLKLSWHFGDCSLIFLLMVEFDFWFLDEVVIALQ